MIIYWQHWPLSLHLHPLLSTKSDIYLCDQGNHLIRKIDRQGLISTIAGTGHAGFNGDNILANTSMLNSPSSVSVSINGDLFVADTNIIELEKFHSQP